MSECGTKTKNLENEVKVSKFFKQIKIIAKGPTNQKLNKIYQPIRDRENMSAVF